MTDITNSNEESISSSLDEMELDSHDDKELSVDRRSTIAKDAKSGTAKIKKNGIFKNKSLVARVLFGVLLLLVIGYTSAAIYLYGTMSGDNPRELIINTFEGRAGYEVYIVGDQLLTPDQRIENLGTIRQRSSEQNFSNTLEFLDALGENNPPDIYRALINPTTDPSLIESTSIGDLPKIGDDGRSPQVIYARPFNEEHTVPEVSIIIHGLGISESLAIAAMRMRPEISLAFSPYTLNLNDYMLQARKSGHEVLLELPMEPSDYPLSDPGPFALREKFSTEKNIAQLEWILSRAQGYVGLINFQGDRMLQERSFVNTILPLISQRGLMFVERGDHGDLAENVIQANDSYYTGLDIEISIEDDELTLQSKLSRALEIAQEKGRVTIGVQPFPMVMMRLALWVNNLQPDQFHLTPISSQAQLFEAGRLGLRG